MCRLEGEEVEVFGGWLSADSVRGNAAGYVLVGDGIEGADGCGFIKLASAGDALARDGGGCDDVLGAEAFKKEDLIGS